MAMGDEVRTLIDQLESAGTMAILVTWMPSSADGSMKEGDPLQVLASDSLGNEATAQKLLAVAIQLNMHLGLLPSDFLNEYMTTNE